MSPFAAIRRSQRHRFAAVFVLVAMLFATAGYVAHGFQHDLAPGQHSSIQCDLCLHFSGTAGAPAQAALPGKPPVGTFAPHPADAPTFTSHEHPTHRLPRAPPALT